MDKDDFRVTSSQRIGSIFASLGRTRAMITAEFDNGAIQVATLILEVDPKSGTCLIDDFADSAANAAIKAKKPFSLRGSDNGVQVFASGLVVTEITEHQGCRALRLQLPTSIRYTQRRDAFRLSLNNLVDINVSMSLTPSQVEAVTGAVQATGTDPVTPCIEAPLDVEGRVLDLSGGGARVLLLQQPEPLPDPVEDELATLTLPLFAEREPLQLAVQWRFSRHSVSQQRQQIGLEFIGLSERTSDLIQRFVVTTQFAARQEAAR